MKKDKKYKVLIGVPDTSTAHAEKGRLVRENIMITQLKK